VSVKNPNSTKALKRNRAEGDEQKQANGAGKKDKKDKKRRKN